ncbi:unnamed protein product, partial [Allacma fusca]
FEEAR